MANASEATVIFLQSHPAWIAAQQRDHQLEEEMRRHPAFLGRTRCRTKCRSRRQHQRLDGMPRRRHTGVNVSATTQCADNSTYMGACSPN